MPTNIGRLIGARATWVTWFGTALLVGCGTPRASSQDRDGLGGSGGTSAAGGAGAPSGGNLGVSGSGGTSNGGTSNVGGTASNAGAGGSASSGGSVQSSGGSEDSAGGTAGTGGSPAVMFDCEVPEAAVKPLKVACVGDSITYGAGADPGDSYPSQLAEMLGGDYSVDNYGVSSTTLLKNSGYSYWDHGHLSEAQALLPNVVVIALGTNDMGDGSFANIAEFVGDYVDMIELFQNLSSHPVVFAAYPPWQKDDDPGTGYTDGRLTDEIIPRIAEAAAQTGACVIDLHAVTEDQPGYYADKLHPNAAGYQVIAETVCQALGACPK